MALTPRQQRFVDEYLVDLNAAAAARRAGYSEPTAKVQAARLLTNANVQEAIAAGRSALSERTQTDAERVITELARIAFSDLGDVMDFSGTEFHLRPACEIPETARRAIASIKVRRYVEGRGETAREVEVTEFRLWPKAEALEKLARHLNLYREREPLEVLLARLEPALAGEIRKALGHVLASGGGGEGRAGGATG